MLGAGPAGLVTAIAAKQAGAKKVVVFEKRDRPDGNAIFALGSVCGWGSRHQKEQGIKDTADDFYAAFDRDILIKTKFCSVRAFQEKALLRSDLFGELVFMALFAPMPESLKHYRPQHRHFLLDESRVSGDKLDKRLILSEFPQGRWFNGHQYAV